MNKLTASISGVILASLAMDMASAPGDCEGLLFGSIILKKRQAIQAKDDDYHELIDQVVAITGHYTTGPVGSFYDPFTGDLKASQLQAILAKRGTLLGWWQHRRESSLRPSARVLAVHQRLEAFHKTLPGGPSVAPLIFASFSHRTQDTTTIHSFDHALFQIEFPAKHLNRIELQITNLVSSSQTEYEAFTASSSFTLPSIASSSSTAPTYVTDLEKQLHTVVQQIKTLSEETTQSTSKIRELEEEIASLKERKGITPQ